MRITASDFGQPFEALRDKARGEPVVITKQGGDHLVVMSAEEWERLLRRDRRVGLAAEWVEGVRSSKVPGEFADFDAELK